MPDLDSKSDLSARSLRYSPSFIDSIKTSDGKPIPVNQIIFTIKIIDNGKGISEDGLKKLFMNFKTLKENKAQNQRGTGLGLSICKQLIEKMGGKI